MMHMTSDSVQEPEWPQSEGPDRFVSGTQNRIRHWARQLVHWLFHPPYFPIELTCLLIALIATNAAAELLVQPANYWIDPATSPTQTSLGIPLKWGLWSIGIYLSYMLLVSMVLSLIHIKPAFALWLTLGVYHVWGVTLFFRCGATYYFHFENSTNCSELHTVSLLLAGMLWGLFLLVAARLKLISWVSSDHEERPSSSPRDRGLKLISLVWIAFLSTAVTWEAITVPEPVWQTIQPAHIPPARMEASLVYDTGRSVAVLFGGAPSWTQTEGWGTINDTWEWDGSDWTQLQPSHRPSPRYAAMMAFDETRGVTVLFGGIGQDQNGQSIIYEDTWEWNGQDWIEVFPSMSPSPRQGAAMYFDPVRSRVVIYGGYYFEKDTATNVFFDDAWAWNGTAWESIPFDERRKNSASAIIFDPIRQAPMLMDGEGVWLWQESKWIPASFPASPPPRWSSRMVYHPAARQIILFAGYKDKDIFNDTWTYNGQTWAQVITKLQPPRRYGHNLFYDPVRGSVVLFGGLEGGTFQKDMWELRLP